MFSTRKPGTQDQHSRCSYDTLHTEPTCLHFFLTESLKAKCAHRSHFTEDGEVQGGNLRHVAGKWRCWDLN